MKRAFLFLLIISCAGFILAQDIVVTKAGTTIEDVTIVSVTADNVVYKQDGGVKTIPSVEVDGILYSDGRYITPPSQQIISSDEVTSSDDSWNMGDSPQQQSYTDPSNKNRSGSSSVIKEILHSEKNSSSTDEKEEKRQKEARKACYAEATRAYMSNYEEIKNRALQQGYSKTQANKLAKKEAYGIYMQALEQCKNGASNNSSSNSSNQDSSTSSDGNW